MPFAQPQPQGQESYAEVQDKLQKQAIQDYAVKESLSIATKGYSIRMLQGTDGGSAWCYTVGLQLKARPFCVFHRNSIDENFILNYVDAFLHECVRVGRLDKAGTLPIRNKTTGKRVRYQMVPLSEENIMEMSLSDVHIEGQAPGTKHFWLQLGDANNLLPNEQGYHDFGQL